MSPIAVVPGAAVGVLTVGVVQPTPGPGPTPQPERGEEYGKASPIALVVVLLLAVALALLLRSMNKHLRKVPESFDPEQRPAEEEPVDKPSSEDSGTAGGKTS